MPLTEVAARNAKARPKQYKLTDGDGLYLLVKTDGGRYWRYDYRFGGKRKTLACGVYPEVSLADARKKRQAARGALDEGRDPSQEKLREKARLARAAENTFKVFSEEWVEKMLIGQGRSEATVTKIRSQLSIAYRKIGNRPIDQIDAPELLDILEAVAAQKMLDTAKALRSIFSRIFRYAIIKRLVTRDPAADLQGAIPAPRPTHHAALFDPVKVGGLLRAIDGYDGAWQVAEALRLAPLVFVRPGELRGAEEDEFDLANMMWRIPGIRMKEPRDHLVPLSRQAAEIVKRVLAMPRGSKLLFPSVRTPDRPLSENTLNAAFRRLGYSKEQVTAHGLRRTASTTLNEMGWNRDWIERQLAHVEDNSVRRVYNAAEYLPDRARMMQAWADRLDEMKLLRAG